MLLANLFFLLLVCHYCLKNAGACLARVNTDAIFKAPCETSVLYPTTGGNMHCFTAVTSCAVLDVLGPPYNDDEGRACIYYKEYAYSSFPGMFIILTRSDFLIDVSTLISYGVMFM